MAGSETTPDDSSAAGGPLARHLTLLDGGMGKELERMGAPFRQPEWSALALMDGPEWVLRAHRHFIEAGAGVITTNAYAVVPFHLGRERFDERGTELAALAGKLAREAADGADRPVLVAGSLPPLFGSYEPERFDPEAAPPMYRTLIEAQAPSVDLWLVETIGCIAEMHAAVDAVAAWSPPGRPLWLSFSVADRLFDGRARLRSGEPIDAVADAVATASATRPIEAVLFNCSQPEWITAAVDELSTVLDGSDLGVRFGAYANAFTDRPEVYSANSVVLAARPDLTPDRYRDVVQAWIDAGATIVGGCCNITPDHIRVLADPAVTGLRP